MLIIGETKNVRVFTSKVQLAEELQEQAYVKVDC